MNSAYLSFLLAAVALLSFLVESYLPIKKRWLTYLSKFFAVTLILGSLVVGILGVVEFNADRKASVEKDATIEQLREDLLKERAKIKSVEAKLTVKFTGKWSVNEEPYSRTIIPLALNDTTIVRAEPKPGIQREPLIFYPTRGYSFSDSDTGFTFYTALALKSDADILSAHSDEIFNFDAFGFYIPLVRWQSYPMKITVSEIILELTINDTELFTLHQYPNLSKMPPSDSGDFNDKSSSFFLVVLRELTKHHFEYKKIYR